MANLIAILRAGTTGAALLCMVSALIVPASAAPANAPIATAATDAGQLAAAVAAVRSITSMRADFLQTDSNGQSVTGVFTIKQPRKFRFQYQPGYPMLIVSDGRALVMIDYEVRQVQRWPLHYTPVGALLDPKRDVSHLAHLQPSADPNVLSILIRDRGHRENGDMTLIFVRKPAAPGGLELAGWETVDAQNRRTIVRLAHQQYGVEVPDDLFTWTDPRKSPRR
jgi:outer membrane lipoprotein-sorting protein